MSKDHRTPFVYLAERADGYIKVGFSQSPRDRMRSLSAHPSHSNAPSVDLKDMTAERDLLARTVRLVDSAPGDYREEKQIHEQLRQYKVEGFSEWFHDRPEARLLVHACFDAFRAKAQAEFSNALSVRRADRLKFARRTRLRIKSEQLQIQARQ